MADIVITVGGDTRPLSREIDKLRKKRFDLDLGGLSKAKNPLGRITGQLGEFEKALEASNARVIAFGASAGALFAVQKGLRAVVESSIAVEKSLSDINVILNVSGKSLEKFSNNLFAVARNTGTSFSTVAIAATELSRQGLSVEDTLKRASDAMLLTRLSGMKAEESVNALTAALNSFSRAAITSTEYVNKLAAVDAAFAVSSEDLAKAISRVGSSAQDAGLGLDELIAAVTAAQQVTARGGAVIGNSFKTIFTRIQRPKVLQSLEELGIAVRDMTGATKPAMEILKSLAKRFDGLAASQRAQIAELVGGVFQVNVLKASLRDLGKEFSLYGNALEISNKATDEASRRNEELNKTMSATLNSTVQNLTKFGASIGDMAFGPVMKKVLGGINTAIEDFDIKSPDSMGEKIGAGVMGGLGKFLEGPGLMVIGVTLIKTFSRVAKQVTDAFKTIAGIGRAGNEQVKTQQKVLQLMQQNPALLAKIQAGELSIEQAHRDILHLIDLETRALKGEVDIVKQLATALSKTGVKVKETLGGGTSLGLGAGGFLSGGYVPNFRKESKDKAMKRKELSSASYAKPTTKAVKDSIPGVGTVYRNTAEKVKKVPGLKQPYINPPENSPEGQAHKIKSIKQNGVNPYTLSGGLVPNFANKAQVAAAQSAMKFVPTRALTGKTMHEPQIGERTTKRLDTEMYGLRPASVSSFHKSAGTHYRNLVHNTTDDVFGSNYNKSAFRFMPEKKQFAQVMGSSLQDMIGGLMGKKGGGGGSAVDLAGGVGEIWKRHGDFGIDKRFTPGLFNKKKMGAPTEIRSTVGSVIGTKNQRTGNWKVKPGEFLKKGATGYMESGGDMAGASPAELKKIMQNLNGGFVPNFKGRPAKDYKAVLSHLKTNEYDSISSAAVGLGMSQGSLSTLFGGSDKYTSVKHAKEQLGAKGYKKLQEMGAKLGKKGALKSGGSGLGVKFENALAKNFGVAPSNNSRAVDYNHSERRTLNKTAISGGISRAKLEMDSDSTFSDAIFNSTGHGDPHVINKYIRERLAQGKTPTLNKQLESGGGATLKNIGNFKEILHGGTDKNVTGSATVSSILGYGKISPSVLDPKHGNKKVKFKYDKDSIKGGLFPEIFKSSGAIPNFASAKGRKSPLYDLDGTIINEGFFKWGTPEEILKIGNKDLTPLGKRLQSSKELVDIATARAMGDAPHIKKSLGGLGLNVGKVMPLASMFTGRKEMGKRGKPINMRGPTKKRLIADKLGRNLVDNDPRNLEALGSRGIPYNVDGRGQAGGLIPNFKSTETNKAAVLRGVTDAPPWVWM